MPGYPIRRILVAASVALAASTAGAQGLDYQRTTMVHGLGGSSIMWRTPRSTLGGRSAADYLEQQQNVALRLRGTPELLADTDVLRARLGVQRQSLSAFVAARGGRHVLVGHSMGSLVSRSLYLENAQDRPQVAGIVAVTAPHQGADIAVNAPRAVLYFQRLQGRVGEALDEINQASLPLLLFYIINPLNWFSGSTTATVTELLMYHVGYVNLGETFSGFDVGGALALTQEPGLPDLAPTDAKYPPAQFPGADFTQIQRLNGSVADQAIPRANVYAEFDATSKIPLRLLLSIYDRENDIPSYVRSVNDGIALFDGCVKLATLLQQKGRKRDCRRARRMLENMDHEWNKVIKGSDTTNTTFRVFGHTYTKSVERARAGTTDGVVPNARSVYPGLNDPTLNVRVLGRNHVNIYKHENGLGTIATVMRNIGMADSRNEPVQPFTGVAIDGPRSVTAGFTGQWSARPIGGRPPYRYHWKVNGSDCIPSASRPCVEDWTRSYRIGNVTTYSLWLSVIDADGVTQTAALTVNGTPRELRTQVSGPASLYGNQNGTFTAQVNGGVAPYRSAWSTGATVTTNETSNAIVFRTSAQGTMTIAVTVTDAIGTQSTASATTTVSGWMCGTVVCQ